MGVVNSVVACKKGESATRKNTAKGRDKMVDASMKSENVCIDGNFTEISS